MKEFLIFICTIVIFIFGIYLITDPYHKAKFKKGDCLSEVIKAKEFIPEHTEETKYLILDVGKEDYKIIENNYEFLKEFGGFSSRNIKIIDKYYILVSCSND